MAHAGNGVNRLLSYAFAGSQFLFGDLGKQHSSYGSIFAFQVLPTIIFISAFFAVLYHIGLMQIIIRGMAWVMLQDDAHLRRRKHERRRQHLHGPDRSAAHDPALSGPRHAQSS